MGQPIEECRSHFGVSEDLRPFSEGEVGGDNQRGLFIELADQMEEQGAARLREWQLCLCGLSDGPHLWLILLLQILGGNDRSRCDPVIRFRGLGMINHQAENLIAVPRPRVQPCSAQNGTY